MYIDKMLRIGIANLFFFLYFEGELQKLGVASSLYQSGLAWCKDGGLLLFLISIAKKATKIQPPLGSQSIKRQMQNFAA